MRGRQATKLRRLSKILHAMLVANGTIPTPESQEEVAFQRRRLFKTLKVRWKDSSKPKSMDLEAARALSMMRSAASPTPTTASSTNSNEPNGL